MNVAVIPARGGSKRISRKNIKLFCGKPIIQWSIEAALEASCFDSVIVSTDDEEIATIAQKAGASIPFIRPAELADDFVGTSPVVRHAVEFLRDTAEMPAHVCCIYATAPFLVGEDLERGFDVLTRTDSDFAFSIASYAFPIQRAIRVTGSGHIEIVWPEHATTRSQDLEETYHDAGQFYWGKAQAWLDSRPLSSGSAAAVILPRSRVQDIDTQEDWDRAECMFRALRIAAASTTEGQ